MGISLHRILHQILSISTLRNLLRPTSISPRPQINRHLANDIALALLCPQRFSVPRFLRELVLGPLVAPGDHFARSRQLTRSMMTNEVKNIRKEANSHLSIKPPCLWLSALSASSYSFKYASRSSGGMAASSSSKDSRWTRESQLFA